MWQRTGGKGGCLRQAEVGYSFSESLQFVGRRPETLGARVSMRTLLGVRFEVEGTRVRPELGMKKAEKTSRSSAAQLMLPDV